MEEENGLPDMETLDMMKAQTKNMGSKTEKAQSHETRKGQKFPFHTIPRQRWITGMVGSSNIYEFKRIDPDIVLEFETFISTTYSSKRPLSSLRPALFNDLFLDFETQNLDQYVLVRTIVKPSSGLSVETIAEDASGNCVRVDVYNVMPKYSDNPSLYIPKGTIMLIKEPHVMLGDSPKIRVDSPTDLIFVDIGVHSKLYHSLKIDEIKKWKTQSDVENKVPEYMIGMTNNRGRSAEEWKQKGNKYFNGSKSNDAMCLRNAIDSYTMGIQIYETEKEGTPPASVLSVLLLNRAAAYLKNESYEYALRDCKRLLTVNDLEKHLEEKALFRAGRAEYGLRRFTAAQRYYERVCEKNAKNSEAIEELGRTRLRVKEEQSGEYDMKEVYDEAQKHNGKVDRADYIGDCASIEQVQGKGRGIIATRDIRTGELIMACKAFEYVLIEDMDNLVMSKIDPVKKTTNHGTTILGVTKIIQKLMKNPCWSKHVYDLDCGDDKECKTAYSSSEESLESFIASEPLIAKIYRVNSFGIFDVSRDKLNYEQDQEMAQRMEKAKMIEGKEIEGSGLWINASYFNHSCIGNCSRAFYGDMMFVYAKHTILKGEELTLTYYPPLSDYQEERMRFFTHHGFICDCRLCRLERAAAGHQFRLITTAEIERVRGLVNSGDPAAIGIVLKEIEQLKSHYKQLNQTECYTMLGRAYMIQGMMKESIFADQELLKEAGLDDVEGFLAGRSVPLDLMDASTALCAVRISCCYASEDSFDLIQAVKWGRVARKLFKVLQGVDNRLFSHFFPMFEKD